MMLEFLNYATAQDILITVSYSGLTKEALIACEIAKIEAQRLFYYQ